MIPLRDTIPSYKKPVITLSLIAANIAVYLYQSLLSPNEFINFIYTNGFIPLRLTKSIFINEQPVFEATYPLFTGMFMHGSLFHLISNMWVLWLFGDNVEDKMGHSRFFIFYLVCGISASIAHYIFNLNSPFPAVGASGAIAGVMGAYFILFPNSQIITLVPLFFLPLFIPIPAVVYLFFWFLSQLYSGTLHSLGANRAMGGIAWWAHSGGFVAGMILQKYFIRKKNYYFYWD